jgi:type I restriction enzyme S subunit
LKKQFSITTAQMLVASSCTQSIVTLNQSILSKAFRGELVEQDPNDEPASVLLERIQQEREKEKAKVKQTGAKKLKK